MYRKQMKPIGDRTTSIITLLVLLLATTNVRIAGAVEQTPEQQACIKAVNLKTSKVAAAQGKENLACVKAATKGTATSGCLSADLKNKVATAKGKTTADESKRCTTPPSLAYTSAASGNTAAQNAETSLFEAIYASLDPTVAISTDSFIGGCQLAVTKAVEKIVAVEWQEFNKCKVAQLKSGVVDDVSDIAACVTPMGIAADLKQKIFKAKAKLDSAVTSACSPGDISSAFLGCGAATAGTLASCVAAKAQCQLCEALNAIDAMSVDCDLFDDNTINGSCGPVPLQVCNLDTTSALTSGIDVSAGDPSFLLSFPMSGSVLVGGIADRAACGIQSIAPIDVFGLGWLCITPGSQTCAEGKRHCGPGPGPALGVAVYSDANVSACATEAACDTSCGFACGGSANVVAAGCTGHCSGDTEQSCTSDATCLTASNGMCNGPEPVVTSGVCQCSCAAQGIYGNSDPGDFLCNTSAHIVLESSPGTGAPCDGTEVMVDIGDVCLPVSTQRASGSITDANLMGQTVPNPSSYNDGTGVPASCDDVDLGSLSGLKGVGAMNFFGSDLGGDMSVALRFTCQ